MSLFWRVFRCFVVLGVGAAMAPACWSAPLSLKTVDVCDDAAEWPPFTFFERAPDGRPTPKVMGYSVDVLNRILLPMGIQVRVQLLPWVRCMREVEGGTNFQVALNASMSEDRQKRFRLTQAYYETTHAYFYSRKAFPAGLHLRSVADLKRYQICGVHGYNYSAYGLKDEEVDRGALDFTRVIAKLHVKRCEVGLEKLEPVAGLRRLGHDALADPDLGWAEFPGLPKGEFHMMVSRQHPQGEALRDVLDQGIKALRESGQLQELRRRYLP